MHIPQTSSVVSMDCSTRPDTAAPKNDEQKISSPSNDKKSDNEGSRGILQGKQVAALPKKVTFNLNANTTHTYLGYAPDDPLRPQSPQKQTISLEERQMLKMEMSEYRKNMELAMEMDD